MNPSPNPADDGLMTCEAFRERMIALLDEWCSAYQKGHAQNPESYPERCTDSEWMHEFLTWLELRAEPGE